MPALDSSSPATRVMIVDDHELFRDALSMLLEAQGHDIVATASNGRHAIELVGELEPDVILMDVRMPILDGIAAAKLIKESWPETKVVMLSAFDDDEYVTSAIKSGADGYILKDTPGEEFGALVAAANGGERTLPTATSPADSGAPPIEEVELVGSLSHRECDVVECVAAGLANKEIATELSISANTVRNHISRALSKLELRNRAEIAAFVVGTRRTNRG